MLARGLAPDRDLGRFEQEVGETGVRVAEPRIDAGADVVGREILLGLVLEQGAESPGVAVVPLQSQATLLSSPK